MRLFVADVLLAAGVTPRTLMKAQGLDPTPLALLKANFNPAQPRWAAGSGRDSGRWSGGDANVTPVAFRHKGHGRGRGFDWIRHFLELFGERRKEPAPEEKPREPEVAKPETEHIGPPSAEQRVSTPKPADFVGEDFGKLGVGVEKPDLEIGEFSKHATDRVAEYGASLTDLQDTVANPLMVLRQSDGRFFYLSEKAVVLLDPRGRVITIYIEPQFDTKIRNLLEHVLERGNK